MGQTAVNCKKRFTSKGTQSTQNTNTNSNRFNAQTQAPLKNNILTVKYKDDEPLEGNSPTTRQDPKDTPTPTPEDVEECIKLSLRLKKKTLKSSSFVEKSLPMLVALNVENLKGSHKTPLDLVCVLDHSGSMSGEKMDLVIKTFDYLLEYLDDSDRLSIVIFNDKAERIVPLMRAGKKNKHVILNNVRAISAGGGTDIDLGMRHAFEILKQRRQMNVISSIFLLSDGLDNHALGRVKNSLNQAETLNDVIINTFGFGEDHDPDLMIGIANLGGGNFHFIRQLDMIDEAFVDCLGDAMYALAQNVEITVKPEQSKVLSGVKIVKAYGDNGMWTHDSKSGTYTTKIATLFAGREKDFVLELQLPTNKKELKDSEKIIKVASAQVKMNSLDGKKIVKNAELLITLLNEVEDMLEEEDDREVMKHHYRLEGARMMSEAKSLADRGNNEAAKKLLENFKEEVTNSFMKEEEFMKNLAKDIQNTITAVDRTAYSTYGRQYIMGNARAQFVQCSTLSCNNNYFTGGQERFRAQLFSKKYGS